MFNFKLELVTVNQSYVGNITNPITKARLDMALSANALARRLGVSRQYLSRAEQGTYSSLNPALLKWVANAVNIHPDAIMQRYVLFQKARRHDAIEKLQPHKLIRHQSSDAGHVIFERWRAGYWTSPLAFSVDFCIHPDLVTKYEEGIQKSMPKQLKAALIENGLLDANWADETPWGRSHTQPPNGLTGDTLT